MTPRLPPRLPRFAGWLGIVFLTVLPAACGARDDPGATLSAASDSAFADLQRRGAEVMGVDQYTSSHVFQPLGDGGLIVFTRAASDSAGVAAIRAHMHTIAVRFAQGDFSLPGLVHAQVVPGTQIMAARRSRIAYAVEPIPGGARLRITTRDPAALAAVHEFLAFQRKDHRAPASTHAHDTAAGYVGEP